jgi:hypothetical protein
VAVTSAAAAAVKADVPTDADPAFHSAFDPLKLHVREFSHGICL